MSSSRGRRHREREPEHRRERGKGSEEGMYEGYSFYYGAYVHSLHPVAGEYKGGEVWVQLRRKK